MRVHSTSTYHLKRQVSQIYPSDETAELFSNLEIFVVIIVKGKPTCEHFQNFHV